MTALDIITSAAQELNAVAAGETLSAEDAALGLSKLNDILDEWAAREVYAYTVGFSLFTLTANHSPHLIGSGLTSPDFAVTQRPVKVVGAALVLNTSTPATDLPMNLRDDDWWRNQRVKALTSGIPTDLYYSPDWPSGALYFWPVPSTAYQVRLELWGLISQFAAVTDSFSLPPGYRKSLTLTLAEELTGPFEKPLTPSLVLRAQRARLAIQKNNISSPRTTLDVPGGSQRASFNWMNGQ
jgi:hypothetical protein